MPAELKKKVKPGAIELHPDEAALVIHYEVQDVDTSTNEIVAVSTASKKVTVKSLDATTDLTALATDIVDKCKLLQPSKAVRVQELLRELLARGQAGVAGADAPSQLSSKRQHAAGPLKTARRPQEQGDAPQAQPQAQPPAQPSRPAAPGPGPAGSQAAGAAPALKQAVLLGQQAVEPAAFTTSNACGLFDALVGGRRTTARGAVSLGELDAAVEQLYDDDVGARAAAAEVIAALFSDTRNFEPLTAHSSLLPTLARLLREDGRRSLELAGAVTSSFCALSTVRQLHRTIGELQVGTLVLELAQLEVQRTVQRIAQEGPAAAPAALITRLTAAAAGRGPALTDEDGRRAVLLHRQQRFLLPAVTLLSNLAEDPNTQKKMLKRELPALLAALLGFPSVELAAEVLDLLRRMAIYSESRARIGAAGALGRALGYLSPTAPPRLQSCALRLVTNLVLERKLRAAAVRYGLVQRLAQLLASLGSGTSFDCGGGGSGSGGTGGGSSSVNSSVSSGGSRSAATGQLHPLVYGCLYLASVEPAGRQALAASELVQRLAECVLRAQDLRAVPELIAVAVNLAGEQAASEWFSAGDRLDRLVRRAMHGGGDELAFKLLRRLAIAGGVAIAAKITHRVAGIVSALQAEALGADAAVEALGMLAAVLSAVPAAPASSGASSSSAGSRPSSSVQHAGRAAVPSWSALLVGCDVFGLVASWLCGVQPDDVLLEAVALAGALAGHEQLAAQLADSGALLSLADVMASKCQDDEFVLQTAWAFARALAVQPTRDLVLAETQVLPYLVDLASDPSPAIRAAARAGLDAVADAEGADSDWALRVRMLLFEAHNQVWLSMVRPQASTSDSNSWGGKDLSHTLPRPGGALGRRAADVGAAANVASVDEGAMPGCGDDAGAAAAVDYGLYGLGGEQQLVLDLESYQLAAEAQHQHRIQEQQAAAAAAAGAQPLDGAGQVQFADDAGLYDAPFGELGGMGFDLGLGAAAFAGVRVAG